MLTSSSRALTSLPPPTLDGQTRSTVEFSFTCQAMRHTVSYLAKVRKNIWVLQDNLSISLLLTDLTTEETRDFSMTSSATGEISRRNTDFHSSTTWLLELFTHTPLPIRGTFQQQETDWHRVSDTERTPRLFISSEASSLGMEAPQFTPESTSSSGRKSTTLMSLTRFVYDFLLAWIRILYECVVLSVLFPFFQYRTKDHTAVLLSHHHAPEHRSHSAHEQQKVERKDSIVKNIGNFMMHVAHSVNLLPSLDIDSHGSRMEEKHDHHEHCHEPSHEHVQQEEEEKDIVGSTDCFGSQLPDYNADQEVEDIVSSHDWMVLCHFSLNLTFLKCEFSSRLITSLARRLSQSKDVMSIRYALPITKQLWMDFSTENWRIRKKKLGYQDSNEKNLLQTPSPSTEERRAAWEAGEPDYLGRDAFVHIQEALNRALNE